jgi:hypothetical protein
MIEADIRTKNRTREEGPLTGQNSVKLGEREGGVKFVFLSLWQQLRCQAEGKNKYHFHGSALLHATSFKL